MADTPALTGINKQISEMLGAISRGNYKVETDPETNQTYINSTESNVGGVFGDWSGHGDYKIRFSDPGNGWYYLPVGYNVDKGTIAITPNTQNVTFDRSTYHDTSFIDSIAPLVLNYLAPGVGTMFGAATSLVNGVPIADVLKSAAINQTIGSVIGGGTETPSLNEATAGFQDVYGGNLPIEDVASAFDTVGPLADTTTGMDTAFVQDMSQGIEQPTEAPNLEGGDLGMTEAEAQNQFYQDIGLNPETVTDTAAVPTSGDTPEIPITAPSAPSSGLSNISPSQIASLLKGVGLLGGLTAAGKLAGGILPSASPSTPTIQAPTPISGTLSAMNPYDANYFQQVQQNYNRLFPSTPANVATPLQNWYQTKFTPDTNISNKLFGV
jgi:hypothetical protein